MPSCEFCPKTYKTIKGLDKHIQNIHPNYNDRFEYFIHLPKNLHYEVFKFLNHTDLLSVHKAHITHIFFSESNFLWKDRFCRLVQTIQNKSKRKFYFKSYGLSYLKYTNSLCFYCFDKCTHRTAENHFYFIPICSTCQRSELPMITKTTAKKKYSLNDKILRTLPSISVPNPHYSCAHDMILYLEKDCQGITRNGI